ncbi:hypothetical protein J2Y48_002904 [Mycoplana sp. BE70]|uniref:CDP-glycerol glycerophosphotransferase family protein n=1 Tax=Mycoplana sp. BE70 TaxID=2817775 RepID=UPI00285EC1F5|nr:CDP-glycerol glycerophosphotransferase family protein [Mycoplana sp. BE70]MDR6757607.1 hypothetical protein [Mycoplana sp. BE70]
MRMWIPLLEESGVPFIVLTRLTRLFDYVAQNFPNAPLAFATSPEHVETLINSEPELRAVLYPSNTGNNIHLLRFNHLEHVFIGHGDSDKSASAHKFFRAYDEIWVSGDAHIDRFKNACFDERHLSFVKVGRPTLFQTVVKSDVDPWRTRFSKPSTLYLPTWEGTYNEQSYTSLPVAAEILASVAKATSGTVALKLHPQTGAKIPALKTAAQDIVRELSERQIEATTIDPATPVEDVIGTANIFVCDVSAVVTDCLAADAPIFVYRPKSDTLKLSESNMKMDHFAYIFSDAAELERGIASLLQEGDSLAEKRMEARQYFMGHREILDRRLFIELARIASWSNSEAGKTFSEP